MKKVFAMAALVIGILILQTPQADAADLYVGEYNGGWKAYLMTETVRIQRRDYMDYSCRVKAIRGSDVVYIDYSFWEDRQRRVIEHFKNSQGHTGMFTVSDANGYYIEYKIDDYVAQNYYE